MCFLHLTFHHEKSPFLLALLASLGIVACSQPSKSKTPQKESPDNTLLWRISGNGLSRPSYLFGTMHMICASDIEVSDSLSKAIKNSDKVYLEMKMDDMMGMMLKMVMDPSALMMRGDTSLSDLLSPEEYKKLKSYFEKKCRRDDPFFNVGENEAVLFAGNAGRRRRPV
jgi:uncharacterized protein YbaP (TraB family)